jgi:CBS-domain-containing membrane protein
LAHAGAALFAGLGGFLGILAVTGTSRLLGLARIDTVGLIGSFGASAVLLFACPTAPLSQPRNLIGGHVLSAIVGVLIAQTFGISHPDWAPAVAVGVAITVMAITRTQHPPGGATALIAVIGSPQVHALGFKYVVVPVLAGALVLLAVALQMNLVKRRNRYPVSWW